MVLSRHLDRSFERLGARIGEEHHVREGVVDKALRQTLAFGNAEQVRGVPHLAGLPGERPDEVRMGVAERIHGDAGAKIEVAFALVGEEPHALASLEDEIGARIGRQQGRIHGRSPGLA
jgi:hypothetical protein